MLQAILFYTMLLAGPQVDAFLQASKTSETKSSQSCQIQECCQ